MLSSINGTQLPKILSSDPVTKYYGLKVGEVSLLCDPD